MAAAAAQLPLRAEHGVVGERLDLGCFVVSSAVGDARRTRAPVTASSAPSVQPLARPADQLGRAEDRGRRWRRRRTAPFDPALRRAADAAAVEERRLGPEEAPRTALAPLRAEVAEHLGALGEERPPLLEERLELREVDDRRIHLDLAEVRVEGGVEREAARHAVLQVEAGRRRRTATRR